MNKCESPIGEKYGRLTVESYYGIDINTRNKLWNCRCECGKVIIRKISKLRSGNTKSCGCYKLDKTSERRRLNISGKRFGRLVAVEPTPERRCRKIMWKCLCDCGNYHIVSASTLVAGLVRSCGCLHAEVSRNKTFKNLTGKRFGRLVVIKEKRDIPKNTTDAYWECQCDCGNVGVWSTHKLNTGNTTSCGCFVKQISRMKMQNPDFQRYCHMMNQTRRMEQSGQINIL